MHNDINIFVASIFVISSWYTARCGVADATNSARYDVKLNALVIKILLPPHFTLLYIRYLKLLTHFVILFTFVCGHRFK